jgi:hypothetical protein
MGYIVVRGNTASLPVYFNKDTTTEGTQNFTFKILKSDSYALDSNLSTTVTVYDNSQGRAIILTTTPLGITNVAEGENYLINVYTTDFPDGTQLAWLIDGVDQNDLITPLSGNVTLQNNYSNVTVITVRDRSTEGLETIYFRILANTDPDIDIDNAIWANIELLDTSLDTSLNVVANVAVVAEGDAVEFQVQTTAIDDGVTLSYSIDGISQADLSYGSVIGKIRHNSYDSGNTGNANVVVRLAKDLVTEGVETMRFSIWPDNSIKLLNNAYANVAVTDNSRTPVFTLTSNVNQVQENATVMFRLYGENVDNATSFSYTITGISASDITLGTLSGDATFYSTDGGFTGNALIPLTMTADKITEGTETMTLTVLQNSVVGLNTPLAKSVDILDFSRQPSLTITANRSSVNEGAVVRFDISSSGVDSGTRFDYTITDIADVLNHRALATYTGSSGQFTVNSAGRANILVYTKEDYTTEGSETLTVSIAANSIVGTDGVAGSVQLLDTSTQPALVLTVNKAEVDEGSTVVVTFSGTNIPSGTPVTWSLTQNAADMTPTSGTVNLVTNPSTPYTRANLTLTAVADSITEGYENAVLTTGANSVINLAATTTSITIKDTSQGAAVPGEPAPIVTSGSTLASSGISTGSGWKIYDIDLGSFTGPFTITLEFGANPDFASLTWGGTSVNTGISTGTKTLTINKTSSVPSTIRLELNPGDLDLTGTGYSGGPFAPAGTWIGSGLTAPAAGVTLPAGPASSGTQPGGTTPPPVFTPLGDGTVYCPLDPGVYAYQGVGSLTSNVGIITGSLSGGSVWGNNTEGYVIDSDFRKAAVHAGILAPGQQGRVRFTSVGFITPNASTANGIETFAWPQGWCGVTIASDDPPIAKTCSVAPYSISHNEGMLMTFLTTATWYDSSNVFYWSTSGNATIGTDIEHVPYFDEYPDIRMAWLDPVNFPRSTWGSTPNVFSWFHWNNYGAGEGRKSPALLAAHNTALQRTGNVVGAVRYTNFWVLEDNLTESTEIVNFDIKLGSASNASVLCSSAPVHIVDTSQSPAASYSLTANVTATDEGQIVQYTVDGTNVDFGTSGRLFRVRSFGTGIDQNDVSGFAAGWAGGQYTSSAVTLTSNTQLPFTFQYLIANDQTTEGPEILQTYLYTWLNGQAENTTSVASDDVTINDTSLGDFSGTPTVITYAWSVYNDVYVVANLTRSSFLVWQVDVSTDIISAEIRYTLGSTYSAGSSDRIIQNTNAYFQAGDQNGKPLFRHDFYPGSPTQGTGFTSATYRLILTRSNGSTFSPPYDLTWYVGDENFGGGA